jgi:hypothetical protein
MQWSASAGLSILEAMSLMESQIQLSDTKSNMVWCGMSYYPLLQLILLLTMDMDV